MDELQDEVILLPKWDLKNIEIRTKTIEKALEPLVMQVTTLKNTNGPSKKRKGKSKKAHVLVKAVEAATSNFIQQGEGIAKENPEISKEMLRAVEEVRTSGELMSNSSREFAQDPCTSKKRMEMVLASRKLLSAVTRLLILADMVDVYRLVKKSRGVENDLEGVKMASSNNELVEKFRIFNQNTEDLIRQAAKRQQELKDPRLQDDLASARAILKKNSTLLFTASKAYVRHPELACAKANRDYVLRQVCEAVNTIHDVAEGNPATDTNRIPVDRPGELASALDDFDNQINMEPLTYDEVRTRPTLEEQLESIISGAALMADSPSTRDDRKHRIVEECNAVRNALQDLLTEYMDNVGKEEPSESLDQAINHVHGRTQDLRRELRKAVVDNVSDSFVDTTIPLLALVEAAKNGDQERVEECAKDFAEYAEKIVEVSNLACSISSDEEGIKMVRYASAQVEKLHPQVVNAAKLLAARHKSKVAQENLDSFKEAWENQLLILVESVDDITTVDDFLAVSENHILEDVKACVQAINDGNAKVFEQVANSIQGRSNRVCEVVAAEMDDYEPGLYTDNVMTAVRMLRENALPSFGRCADGVSRSMREDNSKDIDENDFIEASHLVFDGVSEIRRAVLINKEGVPQEQDGLVSPSIDRTDSMRNSMLISTDDLQPVDEFPEVSGITTTREAMENMSTKDKNKIAEEVENFQQQKEKFDEEVAKFEDSGNDLVTIAKYISTTMMHMTEFTRGQGPLKTKMHVIDAAKKISKAGQKLDALAREIADQCPESNAKDDIFAYLGRINLCCNQLSINSSVQIHVQSIAGSLTVSGVESVTSLVQTAKNLMDAVCKTVVSCSLASAKIKGQGKKVEARGFPWKMKAPEKKPLIKLENPEDAKARIRRGSQKRPTPAIKLLKDICEIGEI